MSYSRNLFINCPFDADYYKLLKPLLFSVVYCKYKPQLAETKDGGEIRIRQIQKLILTSKFSIHDLSRIEPRKKNDLPRFNMPFELGLDLGCQRYFKRDKRCLILEEKSHRYKTFISDLSGQDISSHQNDPLEIIKAVRNWLYKFKASSEKLRSYKVIWDLYNEFLYDFDKGMRAENMDPYKIWEIPFSELIEMITQWIHAKAR